MTERKFTAVFLCVLALLTSPLALSALFLFQSGELAKPANVARWLQRTDGIYGTALNNNLRQIAFTIYKERQPDIIIMSSSRGVDFRREYFSKTFSCVCSIMSDVPEGIQFVEAIKNMPAPKVAIIGLDYWWLSATHDHVTVPWRGEGTGTALTRQNVFSPYLWVDEGKLTATDVLLIAAGSRNRSPLSTEPKLGVQAIKLANGTRADGTWSPLTGVSATEGYMLNMIHSPERSLLAERSGRYSPDQKLDPKKLELLTQLVDALHQRKTKVVLFLLPIINPVVETMETTGRYRFIWEMRQRLQNFGDEYYDFFDPRTFGAEACEFRDPHHGGNVLSARMLKAALDRNPNSVLRDFVDYKVVDDVIQRFAGKTVATIGTETELFKERDFLKLGCRK
jgi:hypothetical protein